jgi:putative transposase
MLINVSTRKFGRAVRLPDGDVPAENGVGLSKSAAVTPIRGAIGRTHTEWMASDISEPDLLVIQIDGIHIRRTCCWWLPSVLTTSATSTLLP